MANEYVSMATLKATLQITGTGSDADLTAACAAASKAIEEACGSEDQPRRFWKDSVDSDRVYTAPVPYGYYPGAFSNATSIDIDDLVSLTSLTLDFDGDGTYETTWTQGTQFYLDPPNATDHDRPYTRLVLLPQAGKTFPAWKNAIKVTGIFGWPDVPPQVTEYAGILAAQLYLRSRQAPFGVVMAGMELGASARISRFDPDFDRLLGKFVRPARLIY